MEEGGREWKGGREGGELSNITGEHKSEAQKRGMAWRGKWRRIGGGREGEGKAEGGRTGGRKGGLTS